MTDHATRIAFSGSPIDRADHVRNNPEKLDAYRVPDARLLDLDDLAPELDETRCLRWRTLGEAPEDAELVFLGLLDGQGCFAAVPNDGSLDPAFAHRKTWTAIAAMAAEDLAIYGGARSLVDWHARHRFCAVCGGPTHPAKGGWQRDCPNCSAQHFPRVDPVAIMLVEHMGRLLLGRQQRFPPGSYSALAGFVEPGETIEEAVAREVFEEAGVTVRDVRYIASQPWPFPSQLMVGCIGRAEDDAIRIDPRELEDARWFTREQVAEALEKDRESTTFFPPPKQAIAHHMLRWWLEQD